MAKHFLSYRNLLVLFILLATLVSFQRLQAEETSFVENGKPYTHYNNYVIFKQSFFNLKEGKDLYSHHPTKHFDLFKYSPSFAAVMLPFAYLPDGVGLLLWNVLNALFLFWMIWALPKFGDREKAFICWIILFELVSALQNSQSNALVAGLIIGAFVCFEKEKEWLATLLLICSVFIKLFGIVGFAMCLLYPRKWKMIVSSLLWILLIGALPLFFVSPEQLQFLYQSWGNQLTLDQSGAFDLSTLSEPSVMGWLESWFGLTPNKTMVAIIGAVIFCVPLLRFSKYKDQNFRFFLLASILIWVVIFNHKAESPTYIIAMSGVGIWFFASERSRVNILLLSLAILMVTLMNSDLFPRSLRQSIFIPYVFKVVSCIVIWSKLIVDSMSLEGLSAEPA